MAPFYISHKNLAHLLKSFSAVIGLLLALDPFVYSNKLAASFYSAPFSRIRAYFDISLNSRHTRLLSAGSIGF